MSDEVQTVVINNERDMCKAGIAREEKAAISKSCPIKYNEEGIITNWDDIEKEWGTVFQELKVDPTKCPVILTESVFNAKENKEKMASIMFDVFKVPSLYIGVQEVFALYASARKNGVAVLADGNIATLVPTHEGSVFKEAAGKINLDEKDAKEIGKFINDLIMKCPENARKELFGNITFLGDATKLKPLVNGITEAIKEQTSKTVKVIEKFDIENPSWVGGSILGALPTFKPMLVTKEIYAEKGAAAF
jgi:actin-related protein